MSAPADWRGREIVVKIARMLRRRTASTSRGPIMRRLAWAGGLFLGFVLLAAPAYGVITALTPLSATLKESNFIVVAKVDALDADKLTMVLTVDESLKGKAPFKRL